MIDFYLSEESPFNSQLQNFAPREGQKILANAIAETIHSTSLLVAEAGTGIGKTFAYLLPALLLGKKVIISTATKHLQDQLFQKDLPIVLRALDLSPKVSVLKGRANYICQHRLNTAMQSEISLTQKQQQALQQIWRFSQHSKHGDLTEFSDAQAEFIQQGMLTSNADNCLGSECEYIQQCFIMKARRKAMDAEIIIVNHHLLLANLLLQQDGLGELLPKADAIIVDEAHQLSEIANEFFGNHFSSRQLLELLRDVEVEYFAIAGDVPELPMLLKRFEISLRDLRLAFGETNQRKAWHEFTRNAKVISALEQITHMFSVLHSALASLAERSKGLENCIIRCENLWSAYQKATTEEADANFLQWVETYSQSFILRQTPLNIAEQFQQHLAENPMAWVFTSATLSANENFAYFTEQLGLGEAKTLRVDSPFDYAKQGVLYVPEDLPEPRATNFTSAMLTAIRPVIEAAGGRAFILFTSHRALNEAAAALQDLPYPLLVQGQLAKQELLQQFRQLGNAVLLGTSSFWEGVDIAGDALSLVIIDKLPFATPDDPIRQARFNLLRKQGRDPFVDYQLPQAIIALKQGAGRLIRDINDRGVLMVCDVRLADKWYRKYFLRSLPAMKRTRKLDEVVSFFDNNS